MKHHIQNSSLLEHLDTSNLLSDNSSFIEFGSGRGALSYWLTKALSNPGSCDLILVDKASPRHKLDTRLRYEAGDDQSISVMRLRLDIGDLDLSGVLTSDTTDEDEALTSNNDQKKIVGVSKHLCGAATDLTLR